ncbi:hypothetical protein Clacol_004683 [Clathrus columnatus]|uniref:Uncharacterized protein n=1 Tax=Clathrus columnatus TaxID=1419009 RepID=A0AAV5A760_9AGAM|nr:hypothetical protein Clacol_004683 [Clathrus columnatus]
MALNEELLSIAGEFQQLSHMTFPFLMNTVANLALVIWDVLLTFEEEDDVCPAFIWYITVLGMIVTACANLLFIHRAFAFYERNRRILWFLGFVFAITETSVLIIIGLAVPKFRIVKNPLPDPFPALVGDCVSGPYPSTIAYLWLSELVFQSIGFLCVIARFTYTQIAASKDDIPASRLYTIFLRDVTYLLNVIFSRHPSYDGLITALWSFTATSICPIVIKCTSINVSDNNTLPKGIAATESLDGSVDLSEEIDTLAHSAPFLMFNLGEYNVANLTVLVWDLFLTFGEEVSTSVKACTHLLVINRVSLLAALFINEVIVLAMISTGDFHVVKDTFPSPFPMMFGHCISISPYSPTLSYVW